MIGVCKLTGKRGKYVKSHILPAALTSPKRKDRGVVQLGPNNRPTRRWSSWYDSCLVTKDGEDILASIDDLAIRELRKHKLVWSGWGPICALPESAMPMSVRVIEKVDVVALRLFFLSILWRAAATDRFEFSEISLPERELDILESPIGDQ